MVIINESKFLSSNDNVGISTLSSTTRGRQLSNDWLFGSGPNDPNSAINRTPGLTLSQRAKLYNARANGKIRRQLLVVKPQHRGAGVTQRLKEDSKFGRDGTESINDIVIIEVPIKK